MDNIVLYTDKYGDRLVKFKANFIFDVYSSLFDDLELDEVTEEQAMDALLEMDLSDLGEILINNIKESSIVRESDDIEHVDDEPESELKNEPDLPYFNFPELKIPIKISDLLPEIKTAIDNDRRFIVYKTNSDLYPTDYEKLKGMGIFAHKEKNQLSLRW